MLSGFVGGQVRRRGEHDLDESCDYPFVQEVLRYLVEEGLVSREEGRWRATGQTPLDMNIPEGLRDVIGKRLSRLSEGCNRVLSVAAVIGREFRVDVLQGVAGVAEDDLFAALEEAQGAAPQSG